MVIWTNYKRRSEAQKFKEVFTLPSLTDQLDDEPITNIINRYVTHNGTLPNMTDSDVSGEVSDVDAVMDSLAGSDVSNMSKVEQQDALATARLLVEQLQASSAEKPALKSETQPASADVVVEGKNENKAE